MLLSSSVFQYSESCAFISVQPYYGSDIWPGEAQEVAENDFYTGGCLAVQISSELSNSSLFEITITTMWFDCTVKLPTADTIGTGQKCPLLGYICHIKIQILFPKAGF